MGVIYWYMSFSPINILIYGTTLGILWQSFTLTDWGYGFYDIMDKILCKIIKTDRGIKHVKKNT